MAWIGTACDRLFPTPIKLMAKFPLALVRAASDPGCVHWKLSKGQKLSSLNDILHLSFYGNLKFRQSVGCSQSWTTRYIHFQAWRLLRDTGTSAALDLLWETSFIQPIILTTKNNIFHSHILLSCKLFLRYLHMEFMRNTCKILRSKPCLYLYTK